jgi:hypothetical protein
MRKICAGRRKGTSIIRKAKWALHGRESFTKLVDDIHRLIADLTTLFASTTTKQIALCDEEAKNIPDSTVSLLKAIAAEYDTMLEAAISKLEAEKVSCLHLTNETPSEELTCSRRVLRAILGTITITQE